MKEALRSAATSWGQCVASYSRLAVRPDRVQVTGNSPLPERPCVWLGWHEFNLTAIAAHRVAFGRSVTALIPPGNIGAVMQGWLTGLGVAPIQVPVRNEAAMLRQMVRSLQNGNDALLAVDGPAGPRRVAKLGALWLAAQGDFEMRGAAFAATPAFRLPRWDRQLVPLPYARVVAVMGENIRTRLLGDQALAVRYLSDQLNDLSERATRFWDNHASPAAASH